MQMKEKIFTIPVNDAFDSGCECPVCYMKRELENAFPTRKKILAAVQDGIFLSILSLNC